MDGLRVEIIKFNRINDTLNKNNEDLKLKADGLKETADSLASENGQLQNRIRELLDANKEVTANYQVVKKNYDIKKHESDDLVIELEEAKNACQLALVFIILIIVETEKGHQRSSHYLNTGKIRTG